MEATQNLTYEEIDFRAASAELMNHYSKLDTVVKYTYNKMKEAADKFGRTSNEHEIALNYYLQAFDEWEKLVHTQYYCYLLSEGMKFTIDYYQYRKGLHQARKLGFRQAS